MGPVVLCHLDRLGLSGLSSLPASFAALADFPPVSLDRATEEAAYYEVGTGAVRPDPREALGERASRGNLLEAPPFDTLALRADMESGTAVDFFTQKEHARCSVHAIVTLSEVTSASAKSSLVCSAIEELAARELPFFVHAILDGPDKTAQEALAAIEGRLGATGRFASVTGRDHALGAALEWDRALFWFRCIVRDHEGAVAEDTGSVIAAASRAGGTEASVPPTRIGDYSGVRGSLEAEFGSAAPVWVWRGSDVGLLLSTRGDELVRGVSLLLRDGLPDEVAAKLSLRDRPLFAFDASSLGSVVRVGASPLRPAVETAFAGASLVERLAAAGKRCATVFDPARSALASFSFDGDRSLLEAVGGQRVEVSDGAGAIAKARALVEAGADFVHIAAAPSTNAADRELCALIAAVRERSGTVFIVMNDAPAVISAGDAQSVDPRSRRDVFTNILAAFALDDQAR